MSSTNSTGMPENFKMALLVLYIVILLAGALNILLMSCMLQSQRRLSYTKVSVINLIAVHGIFLLTVPFRIYYYTLNTWTLGIFFCKIVSLMIHFHMYVGFIFYVFLLIVRFLENCDSQQRLGFQHLLHALIASAAVWLVIFASVFPPTLAYYGTSQNDSTQCFHFSKEIDNAAVKILNCVICSLVVLLWSFLSMLQLYFLHRVRKTFGRAAWNRQEFWAQLKNLFFLSVMFFCFVPYQGFRMYYVIKYTNVNRTTFDQMNNVNEVFLAVTAFSCFDMIVFAGRDICKLIKSNVWF